MNRRRQGCPFNCQEMEENSFEMERFSSDCSYLFSEDEGNSIIVCFDSKFGVVQVTTVNYSLCLELETHGHEDSSQHSMKLCENCAQPAIQYFASNVEITTAAM